MYLFSPDRLVNIMKIDLLFDNRDILHLLKERGNAIRYRDSNRVLEIEYQI